MKLPEVVCDLCGKSFPVDTLKVEGGKVTQQLATDTFQLSAPGADGSPVYLYVCRTCVSTHGTPLES
jgi:hypothetical protein